MDIFTFEQPASFEGCRESAPARLVEATELCNRAIWALYGERAHCMAAGVALAAFLGGDATPVRVAARVFGQGRRGTILGAEDWLGEGRRPAAEPGMWWGHLAVLAGGHVLDPTIDQVEDCVKPGQVSVFAPPAWWPSVPRAAFLRTADGVRVDYEKTRRQNGWRSGSKRAGADVVAWMRSCA